MQQIDPIKMLETAEQAPSDPITLFQEWLRQAESSELNDPNAMCLATTDPDGRPAARMVLLKAVDESGFIFYTNRESRKGEALNLNPHAALCFHWKSLTKSVRVEGKVLLVDEAESDVYYNSRSKGSRIGAWASRQSRPLDSRSTLAARVSELESKYTDSDIIPRPPHWGGYRLAPEYIEFWHDGGFRLHTRLLYKKTPDGWERSMLYP